MVGLDLLVLVAHILQFDVPPADNIFVPLGYNRYCPMLSCVGICRVWPSFLLFSGRTYVGVGSAVWVYLLWPQVFFCVRYSVLGGGCW